MAVANYTDAKTVGAEQQGVRRNNHGASLGGQLKMNMHIGPGKQLPD